MYPFSSPYHCQLSFLCNWPVVSLDLCSDIRYALFYSQLVRGGRGEEGERGERMEKGQEVKRR